MSKRRSEVLREATQEAREKIAAELFDIDKVTAKLADMAGRGYRIMEIAPAEPVTLKETKAGSRLVKVLQGQGIKAEWVERGVLGEAQENASNTRQVFHALRIEW